MTNLKSVLKFPLSYTYYMRRVRKFLFERLHLLRLRAPLKVFFLAASVQPSALMLPLVFSRARFEQQRGSATSGFSRSIHDPPLSRSLRAGRQKVTASAFAATVLLRKVSCPVYTNDLTAFCLAPEPIIPLYLLVLCRRVCL